MIEFWKNLLASDFMPHGFCFLWSPEIVWLHAISDAVIAISYYLIPIALVYFVRKRADLPFHWMFLMFGVFIFGCGTTHVMELWTLWHGTYRLAGVIKAVTAVASVATAILLVRMMPHALALPSPAQLREANDKLARAHDQLEARVRERTAQLADAYAELRAEMDRRQAAEEERFADGAGLLGAVEDRDFQIALADLEIRGVEERWCPLDLLECTPRRPVQQPRRRVESA